MRALVIPARLLDTYLRALVLAHRAACASGNQQVLQDLNVLGDLLEQQRSSARGTMFRAEVRLDAELLTVPQAAERSGRSPRAIRKACEERRLRATKAGRDWLIAVEDLNEYRYGGASGG